jgi:mRNA-degrading endonuclease toxin of MazEF toxin-antitoxin module
VLPPRAATRGKRCAQQRARRPTPARRAKRYAVLTRAARVWRHGGQISGAHRAAVLQHELCRDEPGRVLIGEATAELLQAAKRRVATRAAVTRAASQSRLHPRGLRAGALPAALPRARRRRARSAGSGAQAHRRRVGRRFLVSCARVCVVFRSRFLALRAPDAQGCRRRAGPRGAAAHRARHGAPLPGARTAPRARPRTPQHPCPRPRAFLSAPFLPPFSFARCHLHSLPSSHARAPARPRATSPPRR